jgi:hypothetical protein
VLILLRHYRGVRGRWNPLLEVLTWMFPSPPIVEKEVPWVKLVRTIDPLKEKAPLMALHNKIPIKY